MYIYIPHLLNHGKVTISVSEGGKHVYVHLIVNLTFSVNH